MQIPAEPESAPRLLALRALKLGDLLVAVPAVRGLRRAHPEHHLVLAVPGWLSPIVDLIGGVDELLPTPGLDDPLPVRPGEVDIAVNLHGNGPESRALVDRLEARLQIVHRSPGHQGPDWVDGMLERRRWARLVSWFGAPADEDDVGLYVPPVPPSRVRATVVHIGAAYGSRRWPAERFAEVAAALRDDGATVVVTGSGSERGRAEEVARLAGLGMDAVHAGRTRLDEFAALIAAADLVVSADTGAAHLASAYGIPSVVLFGPAPPEEWAPPAGGPHRVLTEPALRRGDVFASTPDPAMLAISAADVLAAAAALRGVPVRRPLTGRRRLEAESSPGK